MHSSSLRVVQLLQRYPWDEVESVYKRHGISQTQGPQALVEQLERDGGNTLANLFRAGFDPQQWKQGGIGVSYQDIVRDCAHKLKVPLENLPLNDEVVLEEAILLQLVQQYLKDAPPQDREALQKALDALGDQQKELISHVLRGGVLAGGMYVLFKEVGQKAVSQALRVILLRVAGIEGGKMLGRLLGAAIPLVNIALAAWTIHELAGPAFRKTLPTVIDIALLRLDEMHKP